MSLKEKIFYICLSLIISSNWSWASDNQDSKSLIQEIEELPLSYEQKNKVYEKLRLQFDKISEEIHSEGQEDAKKRSCPICLCEFSDYKTFDEDRKITCLPCVHSFCNECIRKSLKADSRCPICKKSCSQSLKGSKTITAGKYRDYWFYDDSDYMRERQGELVRREEARKEQVRLAEELRQKRLQDIIEINNADLDQTEFVLIKAGKFNMGSPSGGLFGGRAEKGRSKNEHLIKNVDITRDFFIGKTPVTQLQYFIVVGKNPSRFKEQRYCPDEYIEMGGISLCPNHPVERVSWDDAKAFIEKLNEKSESYFYALPSEAQWEYAARAGTQSSYSFGDDKNSLGDYAWFNQNSGNQTHSVANLEPNPWGLYDIHGNVWEWTQDSYLEDRSGLSKRDPIAENTSPYRVIRGGCCYDDPQDLRSAIRDFWRSDSRYSGLGLRLVRTPN